MIRAICISVIFAGIPVLCAAADLAQIPKAMDFGYDVDQRSPKFGPSSVYDDGRATYVQLRAETAPKVYTTRTDAVELSSSREGLLLRLDRVLDSFVLVFTDASVTVRRRSPVSEKTPPADAGKAMSQTTPPTTKSSDVRESSVLPAADVRVPEPALKATDTVAWVRFEGRPEQRLSEALRQAIAPSVWTDVVWDVADDFVLAHAFSVTATDFPDLFRRVLAPFGLSARFHRGNHLIHVYSTGAQP